MLHVVALTSVLIQIIIMIINGIIQWNTNPSDIRSFKKLAYLLMIMLVYLTSHNIEKTMQSYNSADESSNRIALAQLDFFVTVCIDDNLTMLALTKEFLFECWNNVYLFSLCYFLLLELPIMSHFLFVKFCVSKPLLACCFYLNL